VRRTRRYRAADAGPGPAWHSRRVTAAVLIATLTCPVHAADSQLPRGELVTADTRIVIEAGETAPRLSSLAPRDAAPWQNRMPVVLPEHVEVHAVAQPLVWRLDPAASRFRPNEIELVYESESPRLRLIWRWCARAAFGPVEHTLLVQNLGGEEVWLPLQPTLRFEWVIAARRALERFWVEKGADIPSAQGTHLDALRDGDAWQGTSSSYARPIAGEPREMIPYVLVEEPGESRRGWYLGIEFSGRTRITLKREGNVLRGEAGLNPLPGPYRTRLRPGESFATPTIFLGASTGGPDGAGNVLRRWVRAVLGNPRTLGDPRYPLMVSNSWGSGMAVNEALAQRMIEDAARLGLEMFHLDAGWFRAVGDWRPDQQKFPHGIARVADFAHARGLKFGLWVDWAQAGTSTQPGALNVGDPAVRDWLIADPPAGWKNTEPFKGITIDLGVPAAHAWAQGELERLVSEYHLDMLEHDGYLVAQGSTRADHPAAPPLSGSERVYEDSGFVWVDASNSTDVSDHATRAYYEIYEQLRARHPQLLLEICNDGGRMVDFGSAAHGDYFSITDTYDPLSNRRAFYDASYVLPPAMLESYVAAWPVPRIENLRYLLRSGMLGWFSLMLDTSRWTAPQQAEARREFALYKSALRPLIRTADLYHVAARPDGVHWDGIEYYSPASGRGVLYAFRGSGRDELVHRFRLQGLAAQGRYALSFHDHTGSGRTVRGQELMEGGLEVRLAQPFSSELVLLRRLPALARAPHPSRSASAPASVSTGSQAKAGQH
jgi:Melibiase/Glycosyl hydrolase family 36 C-terminal domain